MDIVSIIIVLLVIGVALYLLGLVPMDATIRKVIQVLVILCSVIWVLRDLLPALTGHRF